MRGTVAKAARRFIFGDNAHRNTHYKKDSNGAIHCTGDRAAYKRAKKFYMNLTTKEKEKAHA